MAYITWEYYSSLFTEIADEATFDRMNARAKVKLDAVTHMRAERFMEGFNADSATGFQRQVYAQIQNTACELVNALYMQETTGMGTGIASVSNDGYSESYRIITAAEKEAQLCSIVRNGLSGTGLAGAL